MAAEPAKASLINLNTATVAELSTLSGIGQSKAEAIIEYRKQIGSFKNINELTMVKGIGSATFEKNKDRLTIK
jgi:competence protein ComEA